jgi:hypothetical protein
VRSSSRCSTIESRSSCAMGFSRVAMVPLAQVVPARALSGARA